MNSDTAAHTCMHRKVCAYMMIMLNSRPCCGYSQNSLKQAKFLFVLGFKMDSQIYTLAPGWNVVLPLSFTVFGMLHGLD